jgi:hypothetical protein
VQSTPPPFSSINETTGSAPELAPLRPVAPAAPVVVVRRSVVWPLLAVAGVLVAAGALFLVWHQMQQQLPQQPSVINVTQSPANPITPNPPAPPERMDPPSTPPTTHPRPQAPRTYDQALAVQKTALTQCLVDHPDAIAGEAITATINIAPNGHGQSVQLKPDALNAAPLGGCLRNVLLATPFPGAAKANTITVPLKPKTT